MTKIDAYCTLGVDREYDLTADVLLRAMDIAGVDRAVIAPVDRFLAVNNRQGNETMLEAARAHSSRLIPACSANPWCGREAVEELRRSAGAGARLLVLSPAIQGFSLADDLADPLIERATAVGLPVYVHTGGYQFGTPAQLGLAAKRLPDARFIMGHCGSTDFKAEAVEVGRLCPSIFLETSLTRPLGAGAAREAIGDSRAIMGSGAPLNDLVLEWRRTEELVSPAEHPGFYGGTLLRLIGEAAP